MPGHLQRLADFGWLPLCSCPIWHDGAATTVATPEFPACDGAPAQAALQNEATAPK